jgi:hypothetical protein
MIICYELKLFRQFAKFPCNTLNKITPCIIPGPLMFHTTPIPVFEEEKPSGLEEIIDASSPSIRTVPRHAGTARVLCLRQSLT